MTRERRTLRARYQLVDTETNTVLLDQSAGVDAGIDRVSSEYATIAAEDTALERLAGMLADAGLAAVWAWARQRWSMARVPRWRAVPAPRYG